MLFSVAPVHPCDLATASLGLKRSRRAVSRGAGLQRRSRLACAREPRDLHLPCAAPATHAIHQPPIQAALMRIYWKSLAKPLPPGWNVDRLRPPGSRAPVLPAPALSPRPIAVPCRVSEEEEQSSAPPHLRAFGDFHSYKASCAEATLSHARHMCLFLPSAAIVHTPSGSRCLPSQIRCRIWYLPAPIILDHQRVGSHVASNAEVPVDRLARSAIFVLPKRNNWCGKSRNETSIRMYGDLSAFPGPVDILAQLFWWRRGCWRRDMDPRMHAAPAPAPAAANCGDCAPWWGARSLPAAAF